MSLLIGLAVSLRSASVLQLSASSSCIVHARAFLHPSCFASVHQNAPHQEVDSMEVDGDAHGRDEQEEAALRRPYFARPWAPNVRRV